MSAERSAVKKDNYSLPTACPQCDATTNKSDAFCGACGVRLLVVCSACGADGRPEAKFCRVCGVRRFYWLEAWRSGLFWEHRGVQLAALAAISTVALLAVVGIKGASR